ncbi:MULTISPECIES: cell division protein PerM [unclassified Agromyces]|uniref:cell division protein PerM n=1 Tax=unclassified Agromyces TaxID=2639701 RepID=UPI0030144CCA
MRRTTIALLAALEATVSTLIGYGVALVPLMLLWAVAFELAAPLDVFFRVAGDLWLLGHGVDVTVRLDEATAASVGIAGAEEPFAVTLPLLGFAVLTFAFAMRIGRRATQGGDPLVGAAAAVVTVGLLGGAMGWLATTEVAAPSQWQAVLLPALVMAAGTLVGVARTFARLGWATDATTTAVRDRIDRLPAVALDGVRTAVRVGVGAAFGVVAVAAVLVAVRIVLDHATIVGLYQALGAGVDGDTAITMVQLALVPNLVVWAAAWLLGPGFALGAGTTVSPGVTLIGPVPGLPLLGALPPEGAPLGVLWLALPVLLGFAGAIAVATSVPVHEKAPWWATLAVGLGAGVVAGGLLGVFAAWSGGAAGPGRLAQVGPDALLVAAAAAASVGVGAVAGVFAARARARNALTGVPARDEPERVAPPV